jgi:hypothetical protein
MSGHVLTRSARWPRLPAAVQIVFTQIVLVSLPMIFFHAKTLDQSLHMFSHLFSGAEGRSWADFSQLLAPLPSPWYAVAALVAVFELLSWINVRRPLAAWVLARPLPLRWAIYAGLLFALVALGRFEAPPDFAYRKY